LAVAVAEILLHQQALMVRLARVAVVILALLVESILLLHCRAEVAVDHLVDMAWAVLVARAE
jgi:hypothetical protein